MSADKYYYDDYFNWYEDITECVINGIRKRYDICSSDKNLISKKDFIYIGSNNGEIYINDKLNNFNSEHHFFVRQNLKQQRKNKLNKLKNYDNY